MRHGQLQDQQKLSRYTYVVLLSLVWGLGASRWEIGCSIN